MHADGCVSMTRNGCSNSVICDSLASPKKTPQEAPLADVVRREEEEEEERMVVGGEGEREGSEGLDKSSRKQNGGYISGQDEVDAYIK